VQLRPGFGFAEAAAIVGQLAELGVSHLYLSPVLQAVPGSQHGYDVIDHSRVSEDLGGEAAFRALADAAHARGMGILLDIVPNHMAIDPGNRWWWDVLENGPSSLYALFFDVSWDPPERRLKEVILVPVLADHYGRVLEAGELRIEREPERIVLRYGDRALPLAHASLAPMLVVVGERIGSDEARAVAELAAALPDLAPGAARADRLARHRAKEEVRARLARLCTDDDAAAAIDREVARVNGDPDELDALLRRQHYRIAYWRTGARELDYRRFFDINELVGLRVEEPEVFDAVHERIVGWLSDGTIDGVRVDHVDGLRDPKGYLERLRSMAPRGAWIVVEKILHHDERLRPWPVDGTTGYETMDLVGRLFVDPRGADALTRTYRSFTGEGRSFADVAMEAKHDEMRGPLAADVERVTALLVLVCERHRRQRDHTRDALRAVVRELAAAFAVYRTYARAEAGEVADEDGRWLDGAIGIVKRRRPDTDAELLRFLRSLMLLEVRGDVEHEFVMRFQQLTAPVMAKGVEDTAFYRWSRLSALNEVGADPARATATLDELQRVARERLRRWPRSLTPGSTHDSKRSRDVRARIALLSEIPERWSEALARWSARNERHRTGGLPDREMEHLYYQTLVGAHPLPLDRALAYMEKSAREAKRGTSWTAPDERYERALAEFVHGTLADQAFTADLDAFCAPIVDAGRVVSLAQTLIDLTIPGVPDIYQGNELWDLSLVDPDDRRPVDFGLRRRLFAALRDLTPAALLARMDEGLPKLHVIAQALRLRSARPDVFERGAFEPLHAAGERAEHVIAYARCGPSGAGAATPEVVTLVPRLVLRLQGDWRDTKVRLPDARWCDVLTGRTRGGGDQPVADLTRDLPVALLARE
jgi:(1->4)-alpha-D-glucan 1-alpha-D-glucosylmutase